MARGSYSKITVFDTDTHRALLVELSTSNWKQDLYE